MVPKMMTSRMTRPLGRAPAIFALALGLAVFGPCAAEAATFDSWAAVVVAGDWRGHAGEPVEVFDNARREVTANLVRRMGFSPLNVRQFSTRPELYPDAMALPADLDTITDALNELTRQATGGCFVFFTSHGTNYGMMLNNRLLTTRAVAELIDNSCGVRPTIVIVSACYSGIFVAALAADNRMIMTAARSDRQSFGCGQEFEYTYFDSCLLQSMSAAATFGDLARDTQDCVTRRESEEGIGPASEPQVFIGQNIGPLMWSPFFSGT